jgi:hypothetical protein
MGSARSVNVGSKCGSSERGVGGTGVDSVGWLAGPGDGPMDPSPRVMNSIYNIYTHTHTKQ